MEHLPINRLVRSTDLATSLAAAIKASKASVVCVREVHKVMADSEGRIDQEIWIACRDAGYVTSLDTIQHGRLALQEAGFIVATEETRSTSLGMPSTVWRWRDETADFDGIVNDPEWKALLKGMKPGRQGELSVEQAEEWLTGLRELAVQAQRCKIPIDGIVELGRWLHLQARGVPPDPKAPGRSNGS